MGAQRPLLVPWLMQQLDAQTYPGVSWLNPERTLFRVPWKHGSRQSISSEDFQLFEDWAIARGRYRPGIDVRTPSEWKRNFRSALNRKEEVEVIHDNSTDAEDPHKVFQIKQPNNANVDDSAEGAGNTTASNMPSAAAERTAVYEDASSSSPDKTLDCVLSGLNLSSSQEVDGANNPVSCGNLPPPSLDVVQPTVAALQLEQILEAPTLVDGANNPVSCGNLPPPSLEVVQPAVTALQLEQILEAPTLDFEVRTYYRGRQVFSRVFSNVRGLYFVPPGCSGSYRNVADVIFPDPDILNDQRQASYTQRLMQKMAPGVLLCMEDQSLRGMRQGHCHVYWSQSEFPAERTLHGELPKEQLGPIFSVQKFVHELIGFMHGRNGSPSYTLWLCFGEQWPDPSLPWKKKLIMVEVIPKPFEILHEMSKANGASSLGEPDLRISDSLQQSFLDQLQKWEEKMEVQFS